MGTRTSGSEVRAGETGSPRGCTALRPDPYLERLNGEIKRRTNVVGVFPNDESVARLVTAVVVGAHHEWAVAERRYLSEESMEEINAPVEEEVTLAITA